MRNGLVLILGVGCMIGSAICGVLASRPTIKPTTLVANRARLELGEMQQQEKKEVVFRVTNPLNERVTITDVRSTCSCTTPSPGQWVLEPGQSTDITGMFDAGSARGESGALIDVLFRRETASTLEKLELQIAANVKPHYNVIPERIVVNKNEHGKVQKEAIGVSPAMPPGVKVLDVSTDNPAIQVRKIIPDIATGSTSIIIQIDPSRNLQEPLSGSVVLRTDSKMQPIHRVAVRSGSGDTN